MDIIIGLVVLAILVGVGFLLLEVFLGLIMAAFAGIVGLFEWVVSLFKK